MSGPPTGAAAPATRRLPWRALGWELLVFAALFAIILGLHGRSGLLDSELGGHYDEPAHYVTGLMVRDYLAAGCPFPPMTFARDFYDHYPKVALGNWPPVFYLIQGLWSLVTPGSLAWLRALMAALTALVGWVLARALTRDLGAALAVGAAALLVLSGPYRCMSALIMTEVPVALLCLLAALSYGRYLDSERTRHALAFGGLASLAILTKGSALGLALLPPFALLLTRRWSLVKRASFWAPVPLVAILAGPWTLMHLDQARDGWCRDGLSLSFTLEALPYYGAGLIAAFGFGLTALALYGAARRLLFAPKTGRWTALAALALAVLVFQLIVPCGLETRHLLPALAPLAAFAAAGLADLIPRIPGGPGRRRALMAAAFALAGALLWLEDSTRQPWPSRGHAALSADLLARPELRRLLVVSDAPGEGHFIAELARRDQRLGRITLRASQLFSDSAWSGAGYRMLVKDEAELVELIEDRGVDILIFDDAVPPGLREPHTALVRAAIDRYPERFRLEGRYPLRRYISGARGQALVYRVAPR